MPAPDEKTLRDHEAILKRIIEEQKTTKSEEEINKQLKRAQKESEDLPYESDGATFYRGYMAALRWTVGQ